MRPIKARFILDSKGKEIGVYLTVAEFKRAMRYLEDKLDCIDLYKQWTKNYDNFYQNGTMYCLKCDRKIICICESKDECRCDCVNCQHCDHGCTCSEVVCICKKEDNSE